MKKKKIFNPKLNICGQLNDDVLFRAFHNLLPPEQIKALKKHIVVCPGCRKKYNEYQSFQQTLKETAHSFSKKLCPSTEQLITYYQRELPPKEAAQIQGHQESHPLQDTG